MDELLERRIDEHIERADFSGALHEIEEGYGPELLGYLRAKLANDADAEDAYGNVRLAFVKGLHRFQRRCAFRTWAYVIARREARAWVETRGAHAQTSLHSRIPEPASSLPAWQKSDAPKRLQALRAMLNEEELELLVLRVDRAMPFSEIALVLSSSPDTLMSEEACKQRFSRLTRKLSALHAEDRGDAGD